MRSVIVTWRLLFWLVVVAVYVIRRIVIARSKRMHELLEDRATNDLVERARTLAAIPVAKLPEGQVARAVGHVQALETLTAPLDKRPCVAWRVMISALSPAEGAEWELVSEDAAGTMFVLADASGVCGVDPATAAFGLRGGRARTFNRGQALPSEVASYCVARGLSLDDLRSKSLYVVEQLLPVGTKISVAGIGQRVARSASGERDYRASEPTWIVMTAQSVDLLISNTPELLQERATRKGDVEWPGTRQPRGEAISDDFEDRILASRRTRQRVMTAVPLVIIAALGVVLIASHKSASTPDAMKEADREALLDATNKLRIAAYRADDGWRKALADRGGATSAGTCPEAKGAPASTMQPYRDLPLQSARTDAVLAALDAVEGAIKTAKGSETAAMQARVASLSFPHVSVLVEQQDAKTARAFLYDHDKGVIACTTDWVDAATVRDALERGR